MKTVGLFTIYICNYGAILQTYALKKCIESVDSNINVTDYTILEGLSNVI